MIDKLIRYSVLHPFLVLFFSLAATVGGWQAMRTAPLDAIPDLSDTQVILFADWMGRSPDQVEDQVTYPIVSQLVSAAGVKAVRGYSMFGMTFVYAIFEDGTDLYWARARVQEQISALQARMPPGVSLALGPDASGVGWAFQYVLTDTSGKHDLADLRAYQDFTLKYALGSVPGVAEVATFGGFRRQIQIDADPVRMAARGVTLQDLSRALQQASGQAAGRLIELSQREYYVRAQGYAEDLDQVRKALVRSEPGGVPLRVEDVATVRYGPETRRGTADWNGEGEAVGGVVVVRSGENTLAVVERVKQRIEELKPGLPDGMEIHTAYDRTGLIRRAVDTLTDALAEQMITVALVILLFLLHVRSTLVPAIVLPAAVLLAFVPMKMLGVSSNLMSLAGIALAIGDLVDAAVVLVDDAHKKLEALPRPYTREQRINAILQACSGVGPPIFFSLLLLVVSFLPVFALQGQAYRLFAPLAFTKTFSMAFAAILSITLAPALLRLLVRGKIRKESEHPLSRVLIRMYQPLAWVALHNPKTTVMIGVFAVISAIPLAGRLGNEFMPALVEGDLLFMPTTLNGISIAEAQRSLQIQDRVMRQFPEVVSVLGKAGKADTSTDPAPLSMIETVIQLKPREQWRQVTAERWWHADKGKPPTWLPDPLVALLDKGWPSRRPLTQAELQDQLQAALDMAGWTNAWTMPIKARIDMLSTGIRTPVGIKVYGKDDQAIDKAASHLEVLLKGVPGTRSVFAERNRGGYYVDVEPDREALARYGLTVADMQGAVATAVGGERVGTIVRGRERIDLELRYTAGRRQTPEDLANLQLPVRNSSSWQGQSAPIAALQPGPGMGMGGDTGAMAGMSGGSGDAAPPPTARPAWKLAPGPLQVQPFVRLGDVARVVVREGAPMLKDENGSLVGYVFVDVDEARTDVGTWVDTAKEQVRKAGTAPGIRLEWTGQYELMAKMKERMAFVVPLTLLLIFLLLYLNFKSVAQTFLVLGTVPFALVGSIWLLWALDFRLSTAVWVGLIALVGVAAETGIVMLMYLDESFERWKAEGRMKTLEDVRAAALEGAVQRVRPKLMTVSMNIVGLTPVLFADGTGAEVMKRIVAPMVGGLVTSTFLTLEIIPVVYVAWRWRQVRQEQSQAVAPASA